MRPRKTSTGAVLIPLHGGPSLETQRVLNTVKNQLRSADIRAAAVVLVKPNGELLIAHCGRGDGYEHALGYGIGRLGHIFHSG